MANKYFRYGVLSLLSSASTVIMAEDSFTPRMLLSAAYSDNVDRALVSKKSDGYLSGNIGFAYQRETESLSANVDANYLYYGYARNTFPSESLFGLDGVVDWRPIPDVLSWYLEDQYGQVASRPFGALTPATRENVNYLTTGPTLRLAVGQTSAFNVSALYASSAYEKSDIDSNRYTARLQLVHLPSETSSISLNLERQKVLFQASSRYPDYDTNKGFVRVESRTRHESLSIDAGLMSTNNGAGSVTQPLLALTAYRLLGAFSMFGIDFRQGFSDAAESFRFDQRGGSSAMGDHDVLVQASAFRERRIQSYLSLTKPRIFGRISAFYSEETYTAVTGADRDVRGGDLELGYLFNSSFSVKGYAKYEKLHQPAQREQDTDKLVGLEFRKQVTRRSSLELLVERYARNANVASGFVENRATLTWRYQPLQDPRGLNFDPYRGRGLRQPNRAPQTQRDNLPVR